MEVIPRLGAQRQPPLATLEAIRVIPRLGAQRRSGMKEKPASLAFFVSVDDIRANNYDLSLNRYKELVYEPEKYDPPADILARIEALELEIVADTADLREILG